MKLIDRYSIHVARNEDIRLTPCFVFSLYSQVVFNKPWWLVLFYSWSGFWTNFLYIRLLGYVIVCDQSRDKVKNPIVHSKNRNSMESRESSTSKLIQWFLFQSNYLIPYYASSQYIQYLKLILFFLLGGIHDVILKNEIWSPN